MSTTCVCNYEIEVKRTRDICIIEVQTEIIGIGVKRMTKKTFFSYQVTNEAAFELCEPYRKMLCGDYVAII